MSQNDKLKYIDFSKYIKHYVIFCLLFCQSISLCTLDNWSIMMKHFEWIEYNESKKFLGNWVWDRKQFLYSTSYFTLNFCEFPYFHFSLIPSICYMKTCKKKKKLWLWHFKFETWKVVGRSLTLVFCVSKVRHFRQIWKMKY